METIKSYLVSVVIPVYNRIELLEKSLQSVLNQSIHELEIIIVDDGSTDHPESLLQKFTDPRIRFIKCVHTGHIGQVRHTGAKAARGKWIAFLDSDDTWHPRKIEWQLKHLVKTGMRWCYCGFRHVDENGSILKPKAGTYRPYSGWITDKLLVHKASVIICSIMVSRTLYFETGGFSTDPRLRLRGDYEFALRLSQHAEAAVLPDILVDVLEHDGRITRAVKDPYERSMMPYILFLENTREPGLRKLAHRQLSQLIRASSVDNRKENHFHFLPFLRAVSKGVRKIFAS